jgi:nucleoside-diphosphate-sugar epimerase
MTTVLVLGGSGFIGKHVLAAVHRLGCHAVIGSRRPERIDQCLSPDTRDCPRRQARFERLLGRAPRPVGRGATAPAPAAETVTDLFSEGRRFGLS